MPAEQPAKDNRNEVEQKDEPMPENGSISSPAADEDEEVTEDEEEDEPRLKYTKLTASVASVYRNGDDTSTFIVAGDKMIIGTHNGSIHTLGIPSLQPIRLYRAHTASITSLSISPIPPTPTFTTTIAAHQKAISEAVQAPLPSPSLKPGSSTTPRTAKRPAVPNTPSNQIYIASASIDGHVCVSSLVDQSDVTLRNFARPVQAVALSPEYKSDRTYLSGGLAGSLILTVGGKAGVSSDANTNSAAAAASGWLGSIGLGSNTGRDTVLHSGEGAISTIKFSRTSKFVVWVNEHGIKIMRSNQRLDSTEADHAWKRIAHVDRPNRGHWEEMANVWKPRAEWMSDKQLETDEDVVSAVNGDGATQAAKATPKRRPEKLVVGWGDTAWILHVHSGGYGIGKHAGDRVIGRAEVVHKFTFDDCIVSGLSLYTPSLLAILAYRTRDDDDKPIAANIQGTPRRHRQSGLSPELRLISVPSGEEMDVDTLPFSRYESLSASDYHLGPLYIPAAPNAEPTHRGALESIGSGFWDVSNSATRIFSSTASTGSGMPSPNIRSPAGSVANVKIAPIPRQQSDTISAVATPGLKIFIHSPYDCVLAAKRNVTDRLSWLVERKRYGAAWELVDLHPEVVATSDRRSESIPSSPSKTGGSLADFFADENASQTTVSASRTPDSAATREKRRIGDLWLQQLVGAEDWKTAGQVAGKVLGTSSRWEHWVLTFAQADRFDEITPYIPSTDIKPWLPSHVYEIVLGHYISHDRRRFAELLEKWDPEIFDITSVVTAIENKLDTSEVAEDSVEDGEQGRDWRILLNGLAKLKLAAGRPREALRCYIQLQNSDQAMTLIRDYNLLDAISDDIPGLLMLRVSREQLKSSDVKELDESSSEAVQLLADEALSGVVQPNTVVNQLSRKGESHKPFLFFYLRALWRGPKPDEDRVVSRVERLNNERITSEGRMIVEQYADLALSLFANYDRDLLMDYLRNSVAYTLDTATNVCEAKKYIPELVYLLGKTGQTRAALFLIIGELGDVSQAISFTKENPDLWDDLLDYSMDKPPFIRALLSEVGTAIDPIQLIRRIPDGLEIEGLKESVQRMVREYDIQYSISEGVAKVFRGEVSTGMDTLRAGQKRGIKFDVRHRPDEEIEVKVDPVASQIGTYGGEEEKTVGISNDKTTAKEVKPGHCVGCGDHFDEEERDFLVGFACGHVFHLTCLLDYIDASDNDYRLVEDLQNQANEAEGGWTRSVGAKIAHAQIVRSAIKGGCPVCVTAE